MKNIIVPVDFSKISENALWYAAQIAVKAKAQLYLLHVYQFPYISPEIPGTITGFEEIEKVSMGQLKKLHDKIYAKYKRKIEITYAFRFGGVESEIKKFAESKKASLVVIGMQGTGYLAQRFFGSVASSLMHTLKCPVLTVGKQYKLAGIKTIAFAHDYKPLTNKKLLKPLNSPFLM